MPCACCERVEQVETPNPAAGQERRMLPGANHTSCTIEMLNTGRRVDVAVIDEIQVQIRAPLRSQAWLIRVTFHRPFFSQRVV